MTSITDHLFPFGIAAHAYNKDRSQVAVCLDTSDVHIYDTTSWTLLTKLTEHDELVTGIDWAPETNRIVTCSQDRNAYVWTQEPNGTWKPTLVLLRINRAATHVRWSPREDKFAVASGARCVAICYFEEDNDWWVSKHLKKPIRSTVLCVDWHPNNVLLAVGGADMRAYVLSAYIKGVDSKPPPSPWGEKLPFNTICAEYVNPAGGWIHSVAFSPSGDALAFTGHDACITLAYPGTGAVTTIPTDRLPYLSMVWINEHRLVAAGHDCAPAYFEGQGDQWQFVKALDAKEVKKAANTNSAFNMFKQMDSRGITSKNTAEGKTELSTLHQNTITMVRAFRRSSEGVSEFSTSGVDGRLVVWAV
ncbi:actin-like protein ARPC3 [Syncephalis pseudoplumigaleata]|uniref:Actin-related protein 2/3 complex subunit n=1 Tax=Syncephalis pseudoplumigaleata TaxID=1712513 RepID=A0A4V1J1Z1_9FUNG|nr:actin-like protein ARPC3 [Syncephalis pseudoplumigaleata]|eukprot:RKP26739.1 actin-like protein ARPC3 [Syncephalis pseudoplumigaleata]